MAHQKRILAVEEYSEQEESKQSVLANQPRGINRLSSKTRDGRGVTHPMFVVVADLLQSESVTTIVNKRKEKQGEDSGLESGHTSMNTASDTQSDTNSGGEDSLPSPATTNTPDLLRSGQNRNNDFGE